jgi:hypothetical protein
MFLIRQNFPGEYFMPSPHRARELFSVLKERWMRATAAILLAGGMLIGGAGLAQAKTVTCSASGVLDPGSIAGDDLLIDTYCRVASSTVFRYGNVNIVQGGALVFEEQASWRNVRIDFWAKSILVEYGGYLIAGSPDKPFGRAADKTYTDNTLTIHLYGKEPPKPGDPKDPTNLPIACQSTISADYGPCGIPTAVKICTPQDPPGPCDLSSLPSAAQPPKRPTVPSGATPLPPWPAAYKDFFYQYEPLPYDDLNGGAGWFGYKVLAVSEGGSLSLFGAKGAYYGPGDLLPQQSGESWVRLDGDIFNGNQTLKVATAVPSWRPNDHIVVTTTDYLANHSEELVIDIIDPTGKTITFHRAPCTNPVSDKPCDYAQNATLGVVWTHNGTPFSLTVNSTPIPATLNIKNPDGTKKDTAETRAAVGLLSRSIRIVSAGDILGQCFPPSKLDPVKGCDKTDPPNPQNYYFGGHTIARQGFATFQAQGVEFRQLGQGGRLAHYPVHFHIARSTPPNTFLKDSSINESMTRWVTLHGVSDALIERNVGYLSIGHGFYLEDAVETNNKLYSNLGVFARAGVANAQNPRNVPGILASQDYNPQPAYGSDKDSPAVFWITNGWNDFQGNMAAGAGMCGVCFWEAPARMCGPSRREKWASYAEEQRNLAGLTPLKNFDGNYCSSAQVSFQTVGYTDACKGVVSPATPNPDNVSWVANKLAPPSNAVANYTPPPTNPPPPPPKCGPGTSWPICPDGYYPSIDGGSLQQATLCPDDAACPPPGQQCQAAQQKYCAPTVINNYTTGFSYAPYNFSALWLRIRWHLLSNSFVSDVLNSGLTFVSGGDYTDSSVPNGLWDLALQSVFVGQTQVADKAHAYASVFSPFNKDTGLTCDNVSNRSNYCLSKNNSIVVPVNAFSVGQHLFNIYDGPAVEEANAYLNIKKQPLGTALDKNYVFGYVDGNPKAAFSEGTPPVPVGQCYMPNAAIAWKQPNGFYYPPNFRSSRLFFKDVDIRHYVVDPQWKPDTYLTYLDQVNKGYCPNYGAASNGAIFGGFSAVDRQTELTDDDGSLTGYKNTTSVNEDAFFKAPVEGPECASDLAVPADALPADQTKSPGTARTSPYGYVTTVVYPESAFGHAKDCGDPNWNSRCSNNLCFGVPFYRLYQTGKEQAANASPFIRMATMNICQRETMSASHGLYYVDLTPSDTTQNDWWKSSTDPSKSLPPCDGADESIPPCVDRNIFKGGNTYDFFHVYATKDIEQTFKMWVGGSASDLPAVKLIRVDRANRPFKLLDNKCPTGEKCECSKSNKTCDVDYQSTTGILTVKLNLGIYADDFNTAKQNGCVPKSFCSWNGSKCVGAPADPGLPFSNVNAADRDRACAHAGEDLQCPDGGCVGFSVTLPTGFKAEDQTTKKNLLAPLKTCFPAYVDKGHTQKSVWNVTPKDIAVDQATAGACSQQAQNPPPPLTTDFCKCATDPGGVCPNSP